MTDYRTETDSLGEVRIPADRLWGAETKRALEYFDIGEDLIPHEMIISYALVKKAAAIVNSRHRRLDPLPLEVADQAQTDDA